MKLFKKKYWLIYPVLIAVLLFIFDKTYTTDNFLLKAVFCGNIAFILSPRKKIVYTQAGKVKQITWLFLKKPINID